MVDESAVFTFLRPGWLWLVPILLLVWLWWWRRGVGQRSGWEAEVDPALRAHVLEPSVRSGGSRGALALLFGWLLALLILAGPVFERRAVPLYEAPASTVILLDLSRSMLADDLAPNRLTRARFKITDLLRLGAAPGARFALVGFAERPYAISPLTDDAGMLDTFLGALEPDIMPVQGSRADLAIVQGLELLQGAGVAGGSLFLLTDQQPDERDLVAARRVAADGHRLFVLGVGTSGGSPLRLADGQFAKRPDGAIVVPRLDPDALARLAAAGNGRYATLAGDGGDLTRLGMLGGPTSGERSDESARDAAPRQRFWVERGPWLLWPLALCALLLFRRRGDVGTGDGEAA